MKRKKTKLNFVQTCIIYFIIYSIVSISIFQLSNIAINKAKNTSYTTMDNVLEYDRQLFAEDYAKIPIGRMKGSVLVVLDSDKNVIYTTDQAAGRSVQAVDTELINDYYSGSVYNLYLQNFDVEGESLLILKQTYADGGRVSSVDGYCLLNSDLTVRDSNLFPERSSFSERELNLVKGIFNQYHYIEKYSFVTDQGAVRTAFLLTQILTGTSGQSALLVKLLQYLPFIILMVIILLLSSLFARMIRQSFYPLGLAIEEYTKGNRVDISRMPMPLEFSEMAEKYEAMIDTLEDSKKKAELEYSERQRIMASISHDIKTPLTVIQGYTMAIATGMVDEEKKIQYLETITSKAEEMKELANSLLEYTQMDHVTMKLDLEAVDACELARRYLADKLYELELHKFELDIDIPDESIYVMLDWRRFRRVVNNLFSNALRYNPNGTRMLFKLYTEGEDAVMILADDGVGIPENLRDYVFNPLVSGNAARTTGSGTGIGLTITKTLVELHGGTIELSREPEEGYKTQFLIRMKQIPEEEEL